MSRKEECERALENICFPIINTITEEIVTGEQKL